MSFQTTVPFQLGSGVVGEFYDDSPRRVQSYIIDSANAAYNVFGRGFSVTAEGKAAAGNSGGTAVFAGIMINPKAAVSLGTTSGTLNPTLTLPDYSQAELCTMGTIFVSLPDTANIGDLVVYDNTTGELSTIAPGDDLPVGTSFAFAAVSYFTVADAGLAVITLSPTLPIPVLAAP